jgi:hypothetical protein
LDFEHISRTGEAKALAAYKSGMVDDKGKPLDPPHPLSGEGLVFLGLMALIDPPREVSDSAWFPSISQLELRVDGVLVVSRHRDAVEASLRASTRRVRELRQFRDSFAHRPCRAPSPNVKRQE